MQLRKRGRKWWVRFYRFGQRIEQSTRQEDRASAEAAAREIASRYGVAIADRNDELAEALRAVSVVKAFLRSRNLRTQLHERASRARLADKGLTKPEREMRRLLRQWMAFERSRKGGRAWNPTAAYAVHGVPTVAEQVQ